MTDLTLGDFALTRVVESDDPHLVPAAVFPDWDEDAVAPHRSWLVPRHLRENGHLAVVIQSFLITTPHHTILVDSCGGNDKDRHGSHFHERNWNWLDDLAAAGAQPEDIDFVLCTHMHVDHVGWNTRLENGRWVPTFPNARYVFARTEWEHWQQLAAKAQLPRTGNYIADSVLPIIEAGRADLVEMDHEIETGLWLEPLPGHSPGLVGVNLKSGDGQAILCGDMMHHKIQCHFPDWSTNFCTDQAAARQMRRKFLDRHAETGMLIYPAHFPTPTGGYIERAPADIGGEFTFRFLGEER
jgi:glyoxylase-like metal-dependent hydrolase (beta-lactamase superfamily II)